MPSCTAKRKIEQIEFYGGRCHFVDSACEIYAASETLARELNGHYMDQFTYAERATDWRGNNNIADSIFRQMNHEPHPQPSYIVMSAGTGGTSATIGRYIRCQGYDTQLLWVDPQNSVFMDYWQSRDASLRSPVGSKIEGIGRPRVEPSFIPDVVDEMLRVPDAPPASPPRYGWKRCSDVRSAPPPAPTCGAYCSWPCGCAKRGAPALSSRCCATAVNVIWKPTTTRSGIAANIGDISTWQAQIADMLQAK